MALIDHWSKDTLVIHVYHQSYEQPKDTLVIKTEYASYDGIVIKRIYEQPIVGGETDGWYKFDSVKIENNQIKFAGLKRTFGDPKYSKPELSFPLGEVRVNSDSGIVTKVIIDLQYKSMNFTRIDETGKRLYNQPEVLINTFEFTPTKKIKSGNLGEIGIFKDFKLVTQR